MIRVLFFGPLAERVGARELQLEFKPGMSLQDVVTHIQTHYEQAFDLVSCIAVNNAQTRDMRLGLNGQDEIAFMAKFSGG
jgi:molybdopterin synthase sulfur carrier subunit